MKIAHGLFLALTLCFLLTGCGGSGRTDSTHIGSDIGRVVSIEESRFDVYALEQGTNAESFTVVVHGSGIGKRLGFDPITLILSEPSSPALITAAFCNPRNGSEDDVACTLSSSELAKYQANIGTPYTVRIAQGGVYASGEHPTLTFYDSRIGKP